MSIIKVNEQGTNLGTRLDGKVIREKIMREIERGEKVFLDFSDVELVAGSFVDECLGILITEQGFDYVKNKISIKNSNASVTIVLKEVMKNRLRHAETDKKLSPVA